MVTKPTPADPLVPMLLHALALVGDNEDRKAQVMRFFKEAGPAIREAYHASFDDEAWRGTHHE
jgi:hypothetical protein